jgi:YVTN family beta-propeller protein
VAVTPNGETAYVVNLGSNDVSVIDTADNTVTGTVAVGGDPSGVAITPDGNLAYVTNYSSNDVSVIDTADNTITGTVAVGGDPNGLAIGNVPRVEYVKPGSPWTLQVETGFCEVQTFNMGGTWTADDYGDTGTWTGGGKSMDEEFTEGGNAGGYIATTYSKTSKDYSGTGFFDEMSFPVTLAKGAQAGC